MDKGASVRSSLLSKILNNSDLSLTFGFFGIIVLLVLPVSTGLLDFLFAMSIGIALLILLMVIYVEEPAEFSVFPVILLAATLFRLGLNVASTRLILLDGYAGRVIQSFGDFVVRGNYVVGAVVFLILVVINFVVITKGSGRIAEVAARFTLDSLPGKQMSIDAELNAGIIDESVATDRRVKLQKEADFYGAMDGASKFVRGDAIAGILITLINVIGGIAIGVFQKDLPLVEALQRYTLLSVGDGLVSQIPALIVSVGAGILITRTSEGASLGSHLGRQLRLYPRAISIMATMLLIFGLLPGMPLFPFMVLGVSCWFLANFLKKHFPPWEQTGHRAQGALQSSSRGASEGESEIEMGKEADFKDMIQVDIFTVELGYGLLSLADKKQSGDLLDRITGVRQKFAREMGVIIPPISVRDNLDLEPDEYRFLLRGQEVVRGNIVSDHWLAVNVSNSERELKGVATMEPVFGLKAFWIDDAERKHAELYGYTVVDGPSVLITHLSEVVKEKAYLMLEREDTQKIIDLLKDDNPTLISELLPDKVNVGVIQRVLQNLLQERVPIKNFTIILETISDYVEITKNPDDLSEQVRRRLGAFFIQEYEAEPGVIKALTLDPGLEQLLISRIKRSQLEVALMMDPESTQHLLEQMKPRLADIVDQGQEPLLITVAEVRLAFKRFFEPTFPRMTVLSYQEVPAKTQIQSLGTITIPSKASDDPVTHETLKEQAVTA